MEKEVTIRIKIAGYELEVTGPKKWAEKTIKDFVARVKKENKKTFEEAEAK